jgi:hypothetical protein
MTTRLVAIKSYYQLRPLLPPPPANHTCVRGLHLKFNPLIGIARPRGALEARVKAANFLLNLTTPMSIRNVLTASARAYGVHTVSAGSSRLVAASGSNHSVITNHSVIMKSLWLIYQGLFHSPLDSKLLPSLLNPF